MLVKSDQWGTDLRTVCTRILGESVKEEEKYQVGLTKIFFRAGLLARFEQFRTNRLNALVTLMQKNFLRHMAVKRYHDLRMTVIGVQAVWRATLARRVANSLREGRAAILIQRNARGFLQRQRFLRARKAIVGLQNSASFCSSALADDSC